MIRADMLQRLKRLHELRARVDSEIRQIEADVRAVARRGNGGQRVTRRQWIEHGTNAGYQWHHRHRMPFAEDGAGLACGCREAHARYVAIATRRRKATKALGRAT